MIILKNTDKSIQIQLNLEDPDTKERLVEENAQLRKQVSSLLSEIERLKQKLHIETTLASQPAVILDEPPSVVQSPHSKLITKQSAIEDKIACFRDYFKGRDDVFALRGMDRTGKPAYFTQRERLGKVDGKYIWGENIPLSNELFELHLQEKKKPVTIGLYPLLLDETCWFLAIDFDKKSWKEDTAAFLETCLELEVPASLERSRSGNGGHVWIFFNEPILARTARMLGTTLLTTTIEKRHQIGLDSYDRLFPNQDTLPTDKKLGNLIALPLQRIPGEAGNSLFIDSNHDHYKDQWIYLSSIRKMSLTEVEAIVQKAERTGDLLKIYKPITDEDEETKPLRQSSNILNSTTDITLPKHMKIVISNMIYIEKQGLSSAQINYFIRAAAFQNPEFYKQQSMRLPTKGIPRIIDCSDDFPEYIALPRGCYDQVFQILDSNGVEIELVQEVNEGQPIEVMFHGELKEQQFPAASELIKHDMGVLSATTAFGKTVIGTWMIANRSVNTLILVHQTQLMEQWKSAIHKFLNIPIKEIGIIGGGKNKRTGRIDIAMLQSIHTKGEVKDFIADYGQIIVDECHHISAFSFEQAMKKAKAKYVLGLTATLVRKDGHHPIVLMQCGPVRYKVNAKAQAILREFEHYIIPRHTEFKLSDSRLDTPIHEYYEQLIADEVRNDLIFNDLLKALDQGRSPILLTDRTSHLEYFQNRLKGFAKNIIVLRGGLGKKQLKMINEQLQSIPNNEERVLLATGRFAGEGFDDARLDTLFLVMPIAWHGTLQQYAGRLHRQFESKQEVHVYDYVDVEVPVFMRMYRKRLKGYKDMGYSEKVVTQEER